MTDRVRTLLLTPLPAVVVVALIGLDGWGTHRVFIDAAAFDQDGEHFIDIDDREEALRLAQMLSAATGFRVREE